MWCVPNAVPGLAPGRPVGEGRGQGARLIDDDGADVLQGEEPVVDEGPQALRRDDHHVPAGEGAAGWRTGGGAVSRVFPRRSPVFLKALRKSERRALVQLSHSICDLLTVFRWCAGISLPFSRASLSPPAPRAWGSPVSRCFSAFEEYFPEAVQTVSPWACGGGGVRRHTNGERMPTR